MSKISVGVRWGWVAIGTVIAEIALLPLTILLSRIKLGLWPEFVLFGATFFVVLFLTGLWIARKAQEKFVLNGVLVGLFAALLFVPLLILVPPPHPIHEAINEALKIIGGALGGFVAGRKTTVRGPGA